MSMWDATIECRDIRFLVLAEDHRITGLYLSSAPTRVPVMLGRPSDGATYREIERIFQMQRAQFQSLVYSAKACCMYVVHVLWVSLNHIFLCCRSGSAVRRWRLTRNGYLTGYNTSAMSDWRVVSRWQRGKQSLSIICLQKLAVNKYSCVHGPAVRRQTSTFVRSYICRSGVRSPLDVLLLPNHATNRLASSFAFASARPSLACLSFFACLLPCHRPGMFKGKGLGLRRSAPVGHRDFHLSVMPLSLTESIPKLRN